MAWPHPFFIHHRIMTEAALVPLCQLLDISTTLLLLRTICAKSQSEQYIELLEPGRTTYRTALTHVLIIVYFWITITSNGSPYATGPLSCLSVMLVYCGRSNGWMDQDTTWYGGRPRPRWHCVRWGPSSPTERGTAAHPSLGPCLLWPNGRPSQQLQSSCNSSYIVWRHCILSFIHTVFPYSII